MFSQTPQPTTVAVHLKIAPLAVVAAFLFKPFQAETSIQNGRVIRFFTAPQHAFKYIHLGGIASDHPSDPAIKSLGGCKLPGLIHGISDKTAVAQPAKMVGFKGRAGNVSALRMLVLKNNINTVLKQIHDQNSKKRNNYTYCSNRRTLQMLSFGTTTLTISPLS